jgi:hypothetical protein
LARRLFPQKARQGAIKLNVWIKNGRVFRELNMAVSCGGYRFVLGKIVYIEGPGTNFSYSHPQLCVGFAVQPI